MSGARLLDIWQKLVYLRLTEELLAERSGSGDFSTPVHLGIGQELIAITIALELKKGDKVFGNHRSHNHYLASGGDVRALFAEILGKRSGCSGGRGGSMHITAPRDGFQGSMPIVGSTIPIAAGAALFLKNFTKKDIAVVYFGDGATEEGVFHETLNMAAVQKLPILFVCENNLFSSHLHLTERQPSQEMFRFAEAHKMYSKVVNGYSFEDGLDIVEQIVKTVRDSRSPAFLEVKTYRLIGHVGGESDIKIGFQREEDFKNWQSQDPLRRIGKLLDEEGIFTSNEQMEFSHATRSLLTEIYLDAVKDEGVPNFPKNDLLNSELGSR